MSKMTRFGWLVLGLVSLSLGCTHKYSPPKDEVARAGVISMSSEYNRVKPVAEADFTGWVQAEGVLVGSVDNRWVMGVALDTKETLWWVESASELASPITALGKWVVLGFRDGTYMKIDAKTGKQAWQINLDSFSPRLATFGNGVLLILTTSQQLYGIDFESGSTKWLYDAGFPDGLHLSGSAAPVTDGEIAIIGLANGEIHGVELKSGRLRWRHEGGIAEQRFHDVMGRIIIHDRSVIYAKYDGVVQSVSYQGISRSTNWENRVSAVTTTAMLNDQLYVGCLNGDLHAIALADGKTKWTVPTGQTITSITPGEEIIYLGGANGRINAVDVMAGELLWHDDLDADINTNPVIIDKVIYYSTGYKNLYGYQIR